MFGLQGLTRIAVSKLSLLTQFAQSHDLEQHERKKVKRLRGQIITSRFSIIFGILFVHSCPAFPVGSCITVVTDREVFRNIQNPRLHPISLLHQHRTELAGAQSSAFDAQRCSSATPDAEAKTCLLRKRLELSSAVVASQNIS